MPKPSDAEIQFIKELRMDPRWGGLLDKLNAERGGRPYRPGGDKPHDEKIADLIYRAGVDAGIEKALVFLGYE